MPDQSPADPRAHDPRAFAEAGVIQPHGVLLALDAGGSAVVAASENATRMLGVGAVLGADLDDVLGAEVAGKVGRAADGETVSLTLPERTAELSGQVDVTVHRTGPDCVIEIEPADPAALAVPTYRRARGAILRLARAGSITAIARQLAEEVGALAGHDRVGVHRLPPGERPVLLAEWSSDTVRNAPATSAGLAAHLGHATTARARMIADVAAEPVPVRRVAAAGAGARSAPLDLSQAVLAGPAAGELQVLRAQGVTASMSVDLVIDGAVWGVIAAHHHSGPHRPGHDVRAAVEFLARAAAQVLAERQLADARAARTATEQTLAALIGRTSESVSKALEVLIEDPALCTLMGAGGAALCFDNVVTTQGRVPDEDVLRRIAQLLRRDDGHAESAVRLADLDEDLAEVADVAAGALFIGSSSDRWLLWIRPQKGPDGQCVPWQPWLGDAAVALSNHLAGLLYLHSREQVDLATSLQRSVIPAEAPSFPGLDLVARYLPAATHQLGGDWWDVFKLADGRVAFVVGDVAGHGVQAAATMTQLRAAVRAHLFAGETPASSLDRTDLFMDGLLEHVVATAVVGTVDPGTGRAVLAAAGHPPPFLVGNGVARALDVPTRPLLGLAVAAAQEAVFELAPGETLVLYTDGLVERRGVNLGVSLERFGRIAGPGPGPGGLDRWTDRLLAAVPGERDDDTTLLAIRLRRNRSAGS